MSSSRKAKTLAFITSWAIALVMILPLLNVRVMAQATTGTLRGTVTDANGGVVAGATVRAKNEATGAEIAPVTTTSEGSYEFAGLSPGAYTVTVEATSFKRSVTTGTDVKVGIVNPLDVKLQPGNISETVTVTSGNEETLNTDQAQISHSFESKKITDLPSNAAGSGLDTIALLIPGVAQNSGGGTNTNGTGLSVNGNRGRSNNFQIDGADNNDLSVGGPNLFIDNQDTVQEFQVITNNFSAQYGRNLGAVVNIVQKSGTNEFHGSAFDYHRDRRNLDSLNNIERASGQTYPNRFLSNVFGGTFGGPIKKNKIFFFGSYEGIRQPATVDVTSGGFAINAADLPKLTAAFPGNPVINAIVNLNPSVLTLGTIQPRTDLNNCNATTAKAAGQPLSFYSRCNQDTINFTNGAVTVPVTGFLIERLWPNNFTQNEYTLRGDVKATEKDSFYVRYIHQAADTQNSTQVSLTNGFHGDVITFTNNVGGSYIRQISPKIVSEFRATRTNLDVSFGGGCNPTELGCVPSDAQIDAAQIENITLSGITGVTLTGNALRAIGAGSGLPQGRNTILYDFGDNVTWARGRHALVLGAEVKYTTAHVPFLPNYGSTFTFNTQQRVFNDAPSAFAIALGNPNVAYTEWDQYYFVQDDFKIRPNLTLNLGIRYEYTGQPIDDLHDFTVARENGSTPFWNPALPVSARTVPLIPPDKNNFAPRFGFAWVPKFGGKSGFMHKLLGDDATVIRGGYAIAYDPAFYNILLNVANSAPFSIALAASSAQLPATNPLIPLPNSFFGADVRTAVQASGVLPVGKLDPKWIGQTIVDPKFHSPYSQQWSLGIQRQFGKNQVAEIRYVGNHGVGLFQSLLANPFVGVPGTYLAQPGVPAAAVGQPIATTPCTVGGSATLPNCIGGFFGFTRNITVNGVATPVNFPNFSSLLPAGVAGLQCVDNPATPDNEGACNGRILGQNAITTRANTAQSNYHSLQMSYNARFLRNALSTGFAYTYSKTIDDSSEVFAFNGEGSILPQNPFNLHAEKSVSALHRPHIFSFNGIYDVPYFKGQRGILGHLLGGWQINATHVINSGRRYTASQALNGAKLGVGASYLTTGGDVLRPFYGNPNAPQTAVGISQVDAFLFGLLPAGTSVTNLNGFLSLNALNSGTVQAINPATDVRFIYNGPGAARIFGTPFGNVPRYSLTGPLLNQTNIGIFKNTRIFEKYTIQLRAELYNAFNHPNIGYGVTRNSSLPPSENIDNAGLASAPFGDNTQIQLARRVIQFAVKFIF